MRQERPITQADAASFANQLRAAFRSERRRVSVAFADRSLQLDRVSAVEFVVRPADAAASHVFLGNETRPENYPADVPYLPNEVAVLSRADTHLAATWWAEAGLAAMLTEIERQTSASGWSLEPDSPVPDESVIRRRYRKDNATRQIMLAQGILSVVETPARDPG